MLEEHQNTLNMILMAVFLIGGFSYLAKPVGILKDLLLAMAQMVANWVS
jgi:hypothetical protein